MQYPLIVIINWNAKWTNLNEQRSHIRIQNYYIKQMFSWGLISLDFQKSQKNIIDPLTKWLARKVIIKSLRRIRLKPINLFIYLFFWRIWSSSVIESSSPYFIFFISNKFWWQLLIYIYIYIYIYIIIIIIII